MPLTERGKKVLARMKAKYGADKGERVFYATIDKGSHGSRSWHKQVGRRLQEHR